MHLSCVSIAIPPGNVKDDDAPEWLPTIRVDSSNPYLMGLQIGRKFQHLIKSRVAKDPYLHSQLLPFASTQEGHQLIEAFSASNKTRYPRYWSELQGLADGSSVSLLEILLLNFRKEVMPFIASNCTTQVYHAEDCSDISVCSSVAILGHNEDANVSVKDHVFLVHATFSPEASFTAFTLAGELPSCAFGFNTYGVGFTLNSVPLCLQEIVVGGIGRNFVSRDLLEATSLQDACKRIQVMELASGHSYNIFDIGSRSIINVETASKGRFSVKKIGAKPFFHANMYRHLEVSQMEDESSLHRHARAAELSMCTKADILSVLGDFEHQSFPIYMQGPVLQTLCTVLVDMDARTLMIYRENPSSDEGEKAALLFDLVNNR